MHDDSTIWNVCKSVVDDEKKPLDIWRVAKVLEMSEDAIMAALIRETGPRRSQVTFRFPSLPCAAILAISNDNMA